MTLQDRRSPASRCWLVASSLILGMLAAGCPSMVFRRPQPLPTVAGPEDPTVAPGLSGTVVVSSASTSTSKVELHDIASGEVREVRFERNALAHSNLSRPGTLVYVDGKHNGHALRSVDVNESREHELVSRGTRIEEALIAISPSGRRIALAGRQTDLRTFEKRSCLEILDADGELLVSFDSLEIGGDMVWLPDDARLAFNHTDGFSVLETELGRIESHVPGFRNPRVDDAGRWIFAGGSDGDCLRMSASDASRREIVAVPGLLFSMLAALDEDLVLYAGLPTEGAPQQLFQPGLTWPSAMWSIKVARLSDGAFRTVLPHVRGRTTCSDLALGSG